MTEPKERAGPPVPAVPTQPSLDFGAGYVQRAVDLLPRQGDRPPWRTSLNYYRDAKLLRHMPVEDPELHFSRSAARTTTSSSA